MVDSVLVCIHSFDSFVYRIRNSNQLFCRFTSVSASPTIFAVANVDSSDKVHSAGARRERESQLTPADS